MARIALAFSQKMHLSQIVGTRSSLAVQTSDHLGCCLDLAVVAFVPVVLGGFGVDADDARDVELWHP